MTVLALIMTVMLLGFGTLVVDIGRLYNLHSQMQSYVDQVALAAAAELDGEADAIERATRAAQCEDPNSALVCDVQNFAVGSAKLDFQELEFYRALPADNLPRDEYEDELAARLIQSDDPPDVRRLAGRAAVGELLPDAIGGVDRLSLRRSRGYHRAGRGPGDCWLHARGMPDSAPDDLQPL